MSAHALIACWLAFQLAALLVIVACPARSTLSGMGFSQFVSRAMVNFFRSFFPLLSLFLVVCEPSYRFFFFFLARSPPHPDDDDCDDHAEDSGPSLDDNFTVPRSCNFPPCTQGVCVCVHPDSKLRDVVGTC